MSIKKMSLRAAGEAISQGAVHPCSKDCRVAVAPRNDERKKALLAMTVERKHCTDPETSSG